MTRRDKFHSVALPGIVRHPSGHTTGWTAVRCISSQEWKHPHMLRNFRAEHRDSWIICAPWGENKQVGAPNRKYLISGYKWQNTCFLKAGALGSESRAGTGLKTNGNDMLQSQTRTLERKNEQHPSYLLFGAPSCSFSPHRAQMIQESPCSALKFRSIKTNGTKNLLKIFVGGAKANLLHATSRSTHRLRTVLFSAIHVLLVTIESAVLNDVCHVWIWVT